MFLAVVFGLLAGASFAAGGVLQQQEASKEAADDSSVSAGILGGLLQRKLWLAGIALDALSYGFKSLGLAFGAWAVVQPVMATEILFALPASVRRHGHRLGRREWLGVGLVAVGIGVVVIAASPTSGNALISLREWALLLSGLAGLAVVALVVGQRVQGPVRASMYALSATAVLVGMGALMTATVTLFQRGLVDALTTWQPYAMAVAAVIGTTLEQNAYKAGPLAASMPVIDAVNPVLAIAVGVTLFNESITTSPIALIGTVLGVAGLVAGVVVLDTSPLVERVQQEEREEEDDGDEQHDDASSGAPDVA